MKVKFSDLSTWLKVAVVGAWVVSGFYLLMFIVGFIQGMLYY